MIKHSTKYIVVFVFTFLLSGFLFASDQTFDEQYSTKIKRCLSGVYPPSIRTDFWKASTIIYFDNGLYGFRSSYWKFESQALEMANIEKESSGNVNIIYDRRSCYIYRRESKPCYETYFSLVFEENSYIVPISLWVDKDYKYKNLSKVVSITENIETETKTYWFFKDEKIYRYLYVIELNNGTKWLTPKYSKPWDSQSIIGDEVILFGNSQHPFLVDIDAVRKKEYWEIEPSQCIKDLEQL